jgi:hypothetical protein
MLLWVCNNKSINRAAGIDYQGWAIIMVGDHQNEVIEID